MAQDLIDNHVLPRRRWVLSMLGLNWVLCAVTGLSFLNSWGSFPPWFGPMFVTAMAGLLCIISLYIWQVFPVRPVYSPDIYLAMYIWILLVLSVLCTSALHKFFPFRPEVTAYWARIPPRHSILKYNFVLTVGSLVSVLVFSILYALSCRRLAVTGLMVLATIMLVPNDNCGNEFNRPWIRWIGASPLMFMPNSVVLLIGYCGLHGVWPRFGIALVIVINVCVLLLGLGHLSGIVW